MNTADAADGVADVRKFVVGWAGIKDKKADKIKAILHSYDYRYHSLVAPAWPIVFTDEVSP